MNAPKQQLENHEEQVETKNLEEPKVLGVPDKTKRIHFGDITLLLIGDNWLNLEEAVDIEFFDTAGDSTTDEAEVNSATIRFKGEAQDEEYDGATATALFAFLKNNSR